MTLIQKEPQSIKIGLPNYNAMQGPCASGFHVPTKDEMLAVVNAGETLGAWSSTTASSMVSYLKLPIAGWINYATNSGYSSYYGDYWTCTLKTTGGTGSMEAYFLEIDSGDNTYIIRGGYTTSGCSIRPFSDTIVVPDSSWTVLYQGTGDAGIYHNSTLGLISISSDGVNWISMADKNNGATTVYNYGNTLSESNCGKLYQWGNNYGFTRGVTPSNKSTTHVNAGTYGPGNYYSSSTFIQNYITDAHLRDNSRNPNLRGGETGVQYGIDVQKILIGSTQLRPVIPPYLCFTANTAGSTVQLVKNGTPTAVTLETSTDGTNWNSYTFGDTITLSYGGDKVYFRNTSETTTGFSTSEGNRYYFYLTGSVAGSGDITSLLNKNLGVLTLSNYCFNSLFYNDTALTTAPQIPATTYGQSSCQQMFSGCTGLTTAPTINATTLGAYACNYMFYDCTSLTTLPELPATTLPDSCYDSMFRGCTNINISISQGGIYQTPYRIPITGTGSVGNNSLRYMFRTPGGEVSTPNVNQTYYTSNTVV